MIDRPSMKQDDHEAHNMPAPEHNGIDLRIDISGEGQGPYNLGQAMQGARAEQDRDEKIEGTRFHDSGVRIPGRQKGLNDSSKDRPASINPMISGPSSSWR